MNKYPDSARAKNSEINETVADPNLQFPIDSAFLSLAPSLDPQVMLGRIEENMPWRSTLPGEREKRAAEGMDVEFVLKPLE